MVTIFFTSTRLMSLDCLPRGQKYNKDYFINGILESINTTCNDDLGQRVTKHMSIHMDNCGVHNTEEISIKIRSRNMTRLPHPPYFPDFIPCDCMTMRLGDDEIMNL
jgi:hypothetical protein